MIGKRSLPSASNRENVDEKGNPTSNTINLNPKSNIKKNVSTLNSSSALLQNRVDALLEELLGDLEELEDRRFYEQQMQEAQIQQLEQGGDHDAENNNDSSVIPNINDSSVMKTVTKSNNSGIDAQRRKNGLSTTSVPGPGGGQPGPGSTASSADPQQQRCINLQKRLEESATRPLDDPLEPGNVDREKRRLRQYSATKLRLRNRILDRLDSGAATTELLADSLSGLMIEVSYFREEHERRIKVRRWLLEHRFLADGSLDQRRLHHDDGHSPLHEASALGDPAMIELLLAGGANVNLLTKFDLTPLDLAEWHRRTYVRRWQNANSESGSDSGGGVGNNSNLNQMNTSAGWIGKNNKSIPTTLQGQPITQEVLKRYDKSVDILRTYGSRHNVNLDAVMNSSISDPNRQMSGEQAQNAIGQSLPVSLGGVNPQHHMNHLNSIPGQQQYSQQYQWQQYMNQQGSSTLQQSNTIHNEDISLADQSTRGPGSSATGTGTNIVQQNFNQQPSAMTGYNYGMYYDNYNNNNTNVPNTNSNLNAQGQQHQYHHPHLGSVSGLGSLGGFSQSQSQASPTNVNDDIHSSATASEFGDQSNQQYRLDMKAYGGLLAGHNNNNQATAQQQGQQQTQSVSQSQSVSQPFYQVQSVDQQQSQQLSPQSVTTTSTTNPFRKSPQKEAGTSVQHFLPGIATPSKDLLAGNQSFSLGLNLGRVRSKSISKENTNGNTNPSNANTNVKNNSGGEGTSQGGTYSNVD